MPPTDDQENPSSTDQSTSGLTADDVVKIVNQAITSRNKNNDAKMTSMFEEFAKKLDEKFATLNSSQTAKEQQSNEPRIEDNPIYKGMQKKFAELQDKFEQSEREKTAERQKARDVTMRQRVAEELIKAGIDSKHTRHALALLVDAEKRVSFDDDYNLVFNSETDGELDLATGIRTWAKSDDAKVYLPARGLTGSGDKRSPSRQSSNKSNGLTEEEVGMGLVDFIFKS